MEETTEVVDLEMLSLYLEIKTEVVQRIQAECPLDIKRAKLRLFTCWIENDLNACWSKLTAALQSLDKRVLAKLFLTKLQVSGPLIYMIVLFSSCLELLAFNITSFSHRSKIKVGHCRWEEHDNWKYLFPRLQMSVYVFYVCV